MSRREPFLIFGAGGMGRELVWLAEECGLAVDAFIDDAPQHPTEVMGIPVLSLDEAAHRFARARFVSGLGASHARRSSVDRAHEAGLRSTSLVHPATARSRWVEIGEGVVVAAGCILTTNVRIEDNVQINTACTVAHDAVLGRDATLAPGVHLSGWVHVGRAAQVGTGATVINGSSGAPLVIGDSAVVGAGACVTRSVEAGATVVGVPARKIERGARRGGTS